MTTTHLSLTVLCPDLATRGSAGSSSRVPDGLIAYIGKSLDGEWSPFRRTAPAWPSRRDEVAEGHVDIDRSTDNELIEAARGKSAPQAAVYLEALYRRYYRKVAHWCLRISSDRQEAADLAQDVFLRVHTRIDSFRRDSEFSTWLYTVVRSVAINRGMSRQRREAGRVDVGAVPETADARPDPGRSAERSEDVRRLRQAMDSALEPLEARVLYLHHVDGLTLPAITRLLSLENKSGAKAFVVSGMRKLKRHFRDVAESGPRTQERP